MADPSKTCRTSPAPKLECRLETNLEQTPPRPRYGALETSAELIAALDQLVGPLSQVACLRSGLLFRFLAEHAYISKLREGTRLLDTQDFVQWFHELAEEAERMGGR